MLHAVKPAELKLFGAGQLITIRPQIATAFDPVICRQWDLGAPETRNNYVAQPGRDGVDYGAGYLGSRTVTFDLVIQGGFNPNDSNTYDAYWYAEQLAAMTHPRLRCELLAARDTSGITGQTWRMPLQGNPFSVSYGRRAAALLEMQLSFTAPTGLLEGPLREARTPILVTDSGQPFVFPGAFPIGLMGVSNNQPSASFTIGGTAPVFPTVYVVGPAVNPRFYIERPALDFRFNGLTLGDGEVLQVDMAAASALVAGPGGGISAAAYNKIDFTRSTFWSLEPGNYIVQYRSTSGGALTIQWRDKRFTI